MPAQSTDADGTAATTTGARQAEQASHDPYGLAVADVVSRLRRAMRRAARAHGSGGLPGGLSVAQLEFLSCLAENPGARPGQLARLLRLAPSSVATLVNALTREQLIERSGGVTDRRTAVLSLTPSGAGVVTSWQQVNARILTDALASLDDPGRDALARALPALSRLTTAVDALADETRVDEALSEGPSTGEPPTGEGPTGAGPTGESPSHGTPGDAPRAVGLTAATASVPRLSTPATEVSSSITSTTDLPNRHLFAEP